MLNDIDDKIIDIITTYNNIVIHIEQFRIAIDCLQCFQFYRRCFPNCDELSTDEKIVGRVCLCLSQLHALLLSTIPEEWLFFLTSANGANIINYISKIMQQLQKNMNSIVPGSSEMFDVPSYRWELAQQVDLNEIKEILKSTPDRMIEKFNRTKADVIREIDSLISPIEEQSQINFHQMDQYGSSVIRISQVDIYARIGVGTFATIFTGRYSARNEAIAVKFFTQAHLKEEAYSQFACEVTSLTHLVHKGIIRMAGFTNTPPYCILLELMGKSLFAVLRNTSIELSNDEIIMSLAETLSFIHSNGCVHGDIKSMNVLLSSTRDVKLCDFGSCRRIVENVGIAGAIGTPAWSAPELLKMPRQISTKSDVYSLGVLMLEMITLQPPIPDQPKVIPDDVSRPLRDLISRCLNYNPRLRPSVNDIYNAFQNGDVSFDDEDDEQKISANAIEQLLNNPTKESLDLLADICYEIPDVSILVFPKVLKMEFDDPNIIASQLRLFRVLITEQEQALEFIKGNWIPICLKSLDEELLHVRSLFLLLTVVRLSEYKFSEEELNVLLDFPDSDLVSLVLMFGMPFNEVILPQFTTQIVENQFNIQFSLVTGLRYFLLNKSLSLESLQIVTLAMFEVLKSQDEDTSCQSLLLLVDIFIKVTIPYKFTDKDLVVLSKWAYIGNKITQVNAVQMILLIFTKNNEIELNSFEFLIVLLRAFPTSSAQVALGDIIIHLLERKDIAEWFLNSQLLKIVDLDTTFQYQFIVFKMMVICVLHDFPQQIHSFIHPKVIQLVADIMSTNDPKLTQLCCKFFDKSKSIKEFNDQMGPHYLPNIFARTTDIQTLKNLLQLFALTFQNNYRWGNITEIVSPALNIKELQIPAISVIFEEWLLTKDRSIISPKLKKILFENQDNTMCSAFITSLL